MISIGIINRNFKRDTRMDEAMELVQEEGWSELECKAMAHFEIRLFKNNTVPSQP